MAKPFYAKIINDGADIAKAPSIIKEDGFTRIGFTEEYQNSRGYYAVIFTDQPTEEGYTAKYELADNKIIQTWRKTT